MIKPEKYVRKPFAVEAVEVTPENIYEVAKWCGGRVKKVPTWYSRAGEKYVKVQVSNALNERQTMAHYGDWVLSAGTGPGGFKVYTPKAFTTSFQKQIDRMFEVVERMDKRAEEENKDEQEEVLEFPEVDPLQPFSVRG